MTTPSKRRAGLNRRTLLQSSAALALAAMLVPGALPSSANADGKKVIIGAFADGGLTPFKDKIIPLAKAQGFDIQFLEDKVRAEYRAQLPTATLEEAVALLDRYSEWQVLQAALENPSPEVRELAMSHLREFAAAGDPFSLAILEGREIP